MQQYYISFINVRENTEYHKFLIVEFSCDIWAHTLLFNSLEVILLAPEDTADPQCSWPLAPRGPLLLL